MAWIARALRAARVRPDRRRPGPGGDPVVLECELAEPSLFLATSAGAADRLARAIADKIC